jgi:TetR/AcrR family transcriptional regulator, mexJK operon transcriptional repressor
MADHRALSRRCPVPRGPEYRLRDTGQLRFGRRGLSCPRRRLTGEAEITTGIATDRGLRPRGPGGRPSRLQSAQLSERILDVATGLFLGDGYGATSIEGVARLAHISKRTFYHRFPGKEALFEAVVRRLIERWLPRFEADLPEGASLTETLRHAAEHMLQAALTPEALALYRMAITEAMRFPALARILHDLGAAAGVDRITRHLEAGIGRGEIRPIDAQFAAEQFIMMVVTVPRRRALGLGARFSPAERQGWIDSTVRLFIDGCRRG